MIYAVSACLLGRNCKYNGGNNYNERVIRLCEGKAYIEICPEILGGLDVPRVPAEITGGDGETVLQGAARVINSKGEDVTAEFVLGAEITLERIKAAADGLEVIAILKAKSPSCGCGRIYDGNFNSTLIQGDGVTAALLKSKGIKALTEDDI